MVENKRYRLAIEQTREKLESFIKSESSTQSLAVKFVSHIGSPRVAAVSSLYKLENLGGEVDFYFIDGNSEHGLLTLVNAVALRKGDYEKIRMQDCGTYDRDNEGKLESIHLSPLDEGKDEDLSEALFPKEIFQILQDEGLIYTLSGGSSGGGTLNNILRKAYFRTPLKPVSLDK